MPIQEPHKRQKGKNIALALALVALMLLFYFLTIVKMAPQPPV